MRSGELQRVLISDGRGSKLLQLIQEASHATDHALHIGSDGLPQWAVNSLDSLTALWTEFLVDKVEKDVPKDDQETAAAPVVAVQEDDLSYAEAQLGSSTRDLLSQADTSNDLKVVSPRDPQTT